MSNLFSALSLIRLLLTLPIPFPFLIHLPSAPLILASDATAEFSCHRLQFVVDDALFERRF
ncbi:MAG: hypothetical protein SQA66_15855, partial [Candidatus Fervidibacter sacchari]